MATKPDYRLKILNKVKNTRCYDAGAAWDNKDGTITLIIAPGITLVEDENLLYTLFPVDDNNTKKE